MPPPFPPCQLPPEFWVPPEFELLPELQSLPPFQKAMLKRAPLWLRRRLLLRLARRLVSNTYKGSRAISHLRGVTARVEVRASVFCTVREKVPYPLCGFYRAAFTRLLALFDISASTEIVTCRGAGETTCVLNVSIANAEALGSASVEAL